MSFWNLFKRKKQKPYSELYIEFEEKGKKLEKTMEQFAADLKEGKEVDEHIEANRKAWKEFNKAMGATIKKLYEMQAEQEKKK